jgi:ribosomal protein L14
MVCVEGYLKVADNCGIQYAKCIKILRLGKQSNVKIGHFIKLAINKGDKKKNFLNKKVCFGLVLTVKKFILRPAGYFVKIFTTSTSIFLDKEKTVGRAIRSPISLESYLISEAKIMETIKVKL